MDGIKGLAQLRMDDRGSTLWRDRILLGILALAVAALVAVLALRILKETGGTNAYALVAQSFLTGTPWASTCYGADCAVFQNKTYIVFPPFPGVLAMPLVLWHGIATTGFMAITTVFLIGTLWLWDRLFRFLGAGASESLWLLAALGFASPLYYVTLRGDGVWFFAQSIAFFFVTLALHETLISKRLFTAGIAIGCAFLCRQMSIFYAPLILLLAIEGEPLFRINATRLWKAIQIGVPVAVALVLYFAYNYWRFGVRVFSVTVIYNVSVCTFE